MAEIIRAYPADVGMAAADGVPLGGVTLAEVHHSYSEYPLRCFGESRPRDVLLYDGMYKIILELGTDAARLEKLGRFQLQLGARLYDDCRCSEIERIIKADGSVVHKVTIIAKGEKQ